jgi:hypothetical protein
MGAQMRKPTSSTQLAAFLFVDSGGMSRTMLCNATLMVRLSNFYSSFKPNFSRIFCSSFKLFEHQTIRLSRVHCISNAVFGTMMICCGMTLKGMGMLEVTVRMMMALTVKMETVTLIGKG